MFRTLAIFACLVGFVAFGPIKCGGQITTLTHKSGTTVSAEETSREWKKTITLPDGTSYTKGAREVGRKPFNCLVYILEIGCEYTPSVMVNYKMENGQLTSFETVSENPLPGLVISSLPALEL